MKDTTAIGNKTEGLVLAKLLQMGKKVFLPFGGGHKYDLVYEEDGKFVRVQCKTGYYYRGCIVFKNFDNSRTIQSRQKYAGVADVIIGYAPFTDKVYIIPIDDSCGWEFRLRLDSPGNGQKKAIKWAKDYEL